MITPLMSKKTIIIAFTIDLLIPAFFILGEVGVFQRIDCLFVYRSHWKIHISSHVMTFSSTSGCSVIRSMMSEQMFFWLSFCSWVRLSISLDLSYCLFVLIKHLCNHSNSQMSIYPNNFPCFINISFSFWCRKASQMFVIFHSFPTFHESSVPFKN
jgi:hypothetical protein